MAEAEEIRSRIETIKDLSDRLAEQDRTIKDLEEEMRSETPEHPWSFMKMRRHNRLHAEIEDEQTSMSRDRYDLNRLTERLFEDVNIIADKATSTNSLELILDLVEQSLDTDPNYRENVRKQAGVTDGMSYMRLVPQDNPKGMLPPTPWGRDAAEEAYRQHQVRQIDPRLRLLRTLATGSCKDHDTLETSDYLALMDFNVGDQVTMGPGLSTTVTTPHWLGGGGIIFLFVGFGMFNSNALVAIVCLLIAVANFANVMSATLTFHDPSGGANAITVSILEKDKLMSLAQEIQARVFTDADQLRHEESMHMAEKQYTAQTNSVLIQQQMLANQQAQAAQPASVQTLAQAEQTQPSE